MERLRKSWRGFIEDVMYFYDIETKEEIREREQSEIEEVIGHLNLCVVEIDYLLETATGLHINHSRMNELKSQITTYIKIISNKWLLRPLKIPMAYYMCTAYIWKDNGPHFPTNISLADLKYNLRKASELSELFWKKKPLMTRVKQTLCSHCCCI